MITKGDKIVFGIIGLLVMLLFVFWKDIESLPGSKTKVEKVKKDKKDNKDKKIGEKGKEDNGANIVSKVLILEKWDLPSDLKEVSGITYIDDQRFACIQDEEGKIFIFNRASNKIENEIPFAETGDYEGIAVKNNMAYVIRADGRLFEVDMDAEKNSVKEYKTSLTVEQNVEGLCFDKNNNRLLLAIKDDEPGEPGYKGIYAFDLAKKAFIKEPVFKIDLKNGVLNTAGGKKNKTFMPSAIGINATTNEIFITDGPKAMLLIMDNAGTIKKLYQLSKDFAQPEGITFSPQGEIFISNEGTKQSGNILKVEIEK
jgi:uncharacterized protein YjiK